MGIQKSEEPRVLAIILGGGKEQDCIRSQRRDQNPQFHLVENTA
jgi:hypothetical protein